MNKFFLILLFLVSIPATGSDWKQLSGIYAITPEYYLDPSEEEDPKSHLRLQLSGESAKDLYSAMKVEVVIDECTGGKAKNIGNMQCLYFEDQNKYDCHFSIKLNEQTIDYGVAC